MKVSINEIMTLLAESSLIKTSKIRDDSCLIEELLTDSRNLHNPETSLFFAIRTPGGNDGHKFIPQLIEKGVRNFIVEELPGVTDDKSNYLVVNDVVGALALIGAGGKSNAREVVAITGSRGKTTVKEMIFQILEPVRKISRSPRSFNSQIGVPLSLWQIQPESDFALIEAGISRPGEMARHARTINPDVVIFTNIGDAHAEGFLSKTHKAEEKAELAKMPGLKAVIYNDDSPHLREALKYIPGGVEKISFSLKDPNANLFISIRQDDGLVAAKWDGKIYPINYRIDKDFDLENLGALLSFLFFHGFKPSDVIPAIENLNKTGTRLNVSEGVNGCSIILDSYTSDVTSLPAAVDFMRRRKMPGQSLTLIMSDLLHEREEADDAYRKIADLIAEAGISRFFGIGEEFFLKKDLFPEGSEFFHDTEEFLQKVSAADFIDELILLKGSPKYNFIEILRRLEAKQHETVLEVNLDAMVRNYNYFRSQLPPETGLIAMVKAFGYGVGSYEIAKTLQDAGAAYLAVAVLDEGIDLRRKGITMPVMVMNPRVANYKAMFVNRLEPEIYNLTMLKDVIAEANRNNITAYPIHLKLDTGMHRMGFIQEELQEAIELLNSSSCIRLYSVFSHLATADCPDMDDYTELQLARFRQMTEFISGHLPYSFKRHILNSAGILRFPQYHYEMARLGIGLYGANTLPPEYEKPLSPVATLRTVIINIREWKAGETIGYSRKGLLKKDSLIATIPIGYADGLDRHFGNGAISVLINGHWAPTVGNICMDAAMIDVSGINCAEGDSVEIFGENASLQRLADSLGTIPYEILTSVSPRVKRVYYRE